MSQAGRHPQLPGLLPAAGVAVGVAWFALAVDERIADELAGVLAASTIAANLLAARFGGALGAAGSLTVSVVAAVQLGPAAAFAIVVVGELASWSLLRHSPRSAAIQVTGTGIPALAAGTLFELLAPPAHAGPAFAGVVVLVAVLALALSCLLIGTLTSAGSRGRLRLSVRFPRPLRVPLLLSLGLAATFAVLARDSSAAVIGAGVVLAAVGLHHMIALTEAEERGADERTRLAFGVVEGLVRSLAQRDPAAARHAAAVARYAREIAHASGMDERTCGVAHTAGLLHDIGTVALPDRAAVGMQGLEYGDWELIRRHPDLGAMLVRGLGDDVAESVRCHHERPDGRGYPRGLSADQIPPLAQVVAVAEVYDTLTCRDGAAKSSFEALRELRRVAGTQLSVEYVEALARILNGRTAEDRAGGRATIDVELAAHRRIAAPEDESPGVALSSLVPPGGTP
jgi:HD-GYP domain-containing protein (c-di-GMP phosphodiesterase class II)